MSGNIVKINKSDVNSIVELYMSAYNNQTWHEKWNINDAVSHLREIIESPCSISFAHKEGSIIKGCVLCALTSWYMGKQLEIKEIFVNPEYQHHGIGKKMMAHLDSIVTELAIKEIILWTKNDPALESFYKKCGYQVLSETIQLRKIF